MSYKLFGVLCALAFGCAACGDDGVRRCIERAECFAGEHCARGRCAPYNGVVDADAAPDHGDAQRDAPR